MTSKNRIVKLEEKLKLRNRRTKAGDFEEVTMDDPWNPGQPLTLRFPRCIEEVLVRVYGPEAVAAREQMEKQQGGTNA